MRYFGGDYKLEGTTNCEEEKKARIPWTTVWETLRFAAEVRWDPAMALAAKLDRVTKLVDQLGLTVSTHSNRKRIDC